MFEFLLDPSILSVVGTVGGGIVMHTYNKKVTRKKVTREIQGEFVIRHEQKRQENTDPAQNIYACAVYSDRLFEQKLVDAGGMTPEEMTTCDNDQCKNCFPKGHWCGVCKSYMAKPGMHDAVHGDGTRTKEEKAFDDRKKTERMKFAELRERDSRYKGYRYEDYAFQQRLRRDNAKRLVESSVCQTCGERGIHTHTWCNCDSCGIKLVDAEVCRPCKFQQKQKSRPKETVHLDHGVSIKRPKNVPSFATAIPLIAQGDTAPYAIWWQWSYPGSGPVTYRQEIATETIEVTADGFVTRRIESIYDPKTGEHLGEIEVGKTSTGQSWTKILDNSEDREILMLTAGTITTTPVTFTISPDGVVGLG